MLQNGTAGPGGSGGAGQRGGHLASVVPKQTRLDMKAVPHKGESSWCTGVQDDGPTGSLLTAAQARDTAIPGRRRTLCSHLSQPNIRPQPLTIPGSIALNPDTFKALNPKPLAPQDRDETSNPGQRYDLELLAEELRPLVFEDVRKQVGGNACVCWRAGLGGSKALS